MKSKKHQGIEVPKPLKYSLKLVEFFSEDLVTRLATKIFTTPIKHKTPKREYEMDKNSKQEKVFVPKINKEIVTYHYGNSEKKILLVHGWSGRGTQLVKIADELLKQGYATISFDAPGHGKSSSSSTIMTEFIASILELEKKYGPFDYAIGHSLGGMSVLNAIKQGLNVKKAVVIGSGDKITDILIDFVDKLGLKHSIVNKMKMFFEQKFGVPMEDYAAHEAAKKVNIPTLVIHDEEDNDVPVFCAHNIHKHLSDGQIMITQKLGHRKILGDPAVITKIISFIHE